MKRAIIFLVAMLGLPVIIMFTAFNPPTDQYVIISWNDLGMHCSGKNYQNLCILPPYNNLKSTVILRGNATSLPQVITSGLNVTYEIPGNTYSVGKTNFWDYEDQLFGVQLPPNIGLTGVGLTGSFTADGNVFLVEGIPITPYTDNNLVTEDPYQLGLIKVFDQANIELASTQPVVPVSNEMSCVSSGCHSSETAILNAHEEEGGFDPNATPILCAECHADNALGLPGHAGLPSLSQAVHSAHGEETNDCYKCHPGPTTQCFRDVMHTAGMVCQDCHGSVSNVGQTIANGRQPWLQEPSCGATACHGPNFAEQPGMLFKNSRGHSNLYCSTCHGSPHAILPTNNANDNLQNTTLQGYAGILRECSVCHGVNPTGPGPHGVLASVLELKPGAVPSRARLLQNYPNPVTATTHVPFEIGNACKAKLEIFDQQGKSVHRAMNQYLNPGNYEVSFDAGFLSPGVYYIILTADNTRIANKMVVAGR
jgi:hypothetical protein